MMNDKKKRYVADRYSKRTQKTLEEVCRRLAKIETLVSDKDKKHKIKPSEHIYLDRDGIVPEGEHDKTESVYLGTFDNFREWCHVRRGVDMASGRDDEDSAGPLPQSDFRRVIRDSTVAKIDRSRIARPIRHFPRPRPTFPRSLGFIMKRAIQDFAKSNNLQVGSDLYDALNYEILHLMEHAASRAKANKRKTIKAYDF